MIIAIMIQMRKASINNSSGQYMYHSHTNIQTYNQTLRQYTASVHELTWEWPAWEEAEGASSTKITLLK